MGILALDDTDSSIQYSVGWNKGGSVLEYNHTTTWTKVAGATAKISFRGTGIGVYGTISAKSKTSIPTISAYSIDGGALTAFKAVQDAKAQYSQLFFQSPSLTDGAHVLTVTNSLIADPLFLDFLLVSQTTDTPGTVVSSSSAVSSLTSLPISTSTSSSSSSSSLTTSSVVTTSKPIPVTVTITSLTPSSTSGAADAAKATGDAVGGAKKSNTGAVIGGVLGTVVILLAFAFGFVYYNRKRLQRQRRESLAVYTSSENPNYWNRPLATAVTPHSDQTMESNVISPSPPPGPVPNMMQNENYAPSALSNSGSAAYGQSQTPTQYPGGYTPGADYYGGSSDAAYNVNAAPAQGYALPSQLVNQNQNQNQGGAAGVGSAYGSYGYGYGYSEANAYGNEYNRAGSGAPYHSQGGYGYGN